MLFGASETRLRFDRGLPQFQRRKIDADSLRLEDLIVLRYSLSEQLVSRIEMNRPRSELALFSDTRINQRIWLGKKSHSVNDQGCQGLTSRKLDIRTK